MENDKDNSENVNIAEVRKCLKEAGCYDPSMTDNEMMEIYQVLNLSKDTASAEDQQRGIMEKTEKNCSMLEELRRNSVPVYREKDTKNMSKNDSDVSTSSGDQTEDELNLLQKGNSSTPMTKQTDEDEVSSTAVPAKRVKHNQNEEPVEDNIDVFNSIPTTHKPLKRITIHPKYNPPFYCDPKLDNVNHEQKAFLFAQYHLKLVRKYDTYQRQSIISAPWDKPIQTNMRFNGSLMRKIEKLPEESDIDSQEFLQPLKEERNSEDDFEIYVSQSGRQTKRKLYCEDVDNNNEPKKNKTSLTDSGQKTSKLQTKKRQLTNEEIVKRSKLFAEPTRTEKMFEKLAENEEKKKVAEKEADKFTETLKALSDEENVDDLSNDIAEIVHSEEPFIRRRIVPPSRAKNVTKRNPSSSKSNGRGRGKSVNKKSSQENATPQTDIRKYSPLETSTYSDKDIGKEETGTCPMCNVEFPQSELTRHASGCGDSFSERPRRSYSYGLNKIACENCDEVLPLNMDYEEHVKDCLAKARRSSSARV